MTDLLDRAVRFSTRAEERASASVSVRGALAALWAAAMGLATVLVVVLVAWAADPRSGSGAGPAVRTALQVWLLAHHAALSVSGAELGLAPLGLTVLPLLLVGRGARVVASGSGEAGLGAAVRVTAAVAVPYALLTAVVTALAATPRVRPLPVHALISGAALAVLAAGVGAIRSTVGWGELAARLPGGVRAAVVAGAGAVCVLMAGGAGLAVVATLAHRGDVTHVMQALRPGAVGQAALLLLDLVLAPNAAVCGLSYLVGPGFAVGAGSSVGPFATHLGALPALPVLAALPRAPAGWPVLLVQLAVLVSAGVVAGVLLVGSRPADSGLRRVRCGLGAGASAGVLVALLAALAGGPAGPGALSVLGPSPWLTGFATAGEVALGAVAASAVLAWRRG